MSTTTGTRLRRIALLKLPEYEVPRLITIAGAIMNAMTGNPSFPSPDPPLAKIQAAIDALADAEATALMRKKGSVARRDDRRLALVMLLEQLRGHVQATADADLEHAASIIEKAGMHVKKTSVMPARVFTARRGPVSRSIRLIAPRAGKYASYEWACSTDGKKTWVALPPTTQANTLVHGLEPGTTAHFRYRAVTKDGPGDWSDPVEIIVD